MVYTYIDTPIGPLLLAANRVGMLSLVGFQQGSMRRDAAPDWARDDTFFNEISQQFSAYFLGKLRVFDLPMESAGTYFQRRVWSALAKIPYGTTATYGELAQRIGQPGAARAIGAANSRNPLPILQPCHRVIGRSGNLTGFGGGLAVKKTLLDLEQRHACAQC